jgi:hypothetical protein
MIQGESMQEDYDRFLFGAKGLIVDVAIVQSDTGHLSQNLEASSSQVFSTQETHHDWDKTVIL